MAILVAAAGCDAAPADAGRAALMRVEGAQFYPGASASDESGPAVEGLLDPQTAVYPGEVEKPLAGTLAAGATAAVLFLDGDQGYWVLPAAVPDITAPDQPTFRATLSFSPELAEGSRDVIVRAADAEGRLGPPSTDTLQVTPLPAPQGALVVTLRWDREVDLDLHVVEPDGFELWAKRPSDVVDKPAGSTSDGGASVGTLDFDSNADCVIDARREESAVWPSTPPAGNYLVRVDAFSLCGQSFANFTVEVRENGALVAQASRALDESATLGTHERGSGLSVLTFDAP